jgi:hypothetical protein
MCRLLIHLLVGGMLVGLAGTNPALAASHTSSKGPRKVAARTCRNCGMTHSTRKTKAMPRAVKISGTTYYCCASCGPHFKAKPKG